MIMISLKVFTSSDSYNDNGCQLAYIGCLHFALTTERVNPFAAVSLTWLRSCRSESRAKVQTFFNNQHFSQVFFHIRCCGPLWVCATDGV